MAKSPENIITLPAGTELNFGPSEDSDSVVALKDIKVLVMNEGEVQEGAVQVRIIQDGQPDSRVLFFHQPPSATKI